LNAANEVAVAAFLKGQIGFLEIAALVETTLTGYDPNSMPVSLDDLFSIDAAARAYASAQLKKVAHASS
jgi:1-deoxy-D-xylulose-5-phosphate reductoisomerase